MKKLKTSVFNTDDFSVEIDETPEGINIDIWVRDGELIGGHSYYKEDYFEEKK